MSLRAELIGATETDPAFAVLLPDGWEGDDAGFGEMDARLDAALAQLPIASRGAARARMRDILATARTEAARADVIRVFTPSRSTGEEPPPVTLVASWVTAPAGATVAAMGADLIRRRDARPLDPGQTIITWSTDSSSESDGTVVDVAGSGYLLRVPGSTRKALVFRSTMLRAVGETTIADEGIAAMSLLCDAIVASVRWRHDA
ncbi:hypothetical protein [Microbacterium pygmaeum]|uniref:Uncharacterized protein n=1 Tax=Microbacterium pygmaeum TaxID=370764 RepID=A0A1G7VTX5_9MICO|nr:hypothetical protein [Microbacterium pygmaeum]SDG63223.1 hypothetical protein SAMN04489810_0836 [Microbacterium pygmaeum]